MGSDRSSGANDGNGQGGPGPQPISAPAISLPKGGGAIKGIGEKFAANPVTGTGSLTVPIATSPGRSGFGPQLSLSYDSGAGNGVFGLGWNLSLPSITRKTDKGLPRYRDTKDSDDFILSGAEDLVPLLVKVGDAWVPEVIPPRVLHGKTYTVRRYRPRIEGLFARIERWTNQTDPSDVFWRSISKDNITTWYGKSENTRIADPKDATHIFTWLICESYDDKGNVIVYEYKPEDSTDIKLSQAHERNRSVETRSANRYLKSIKYGNRTPHFPVLHEINPPIPLPAEWLFQVVFDYAEHHADTPLPGDTGSWLCRNDPFSSYRASFEIRTYRLCQRALMFHHFPDEEGVGADCLVRSTDFTYAYENDPINSRNPILSFLNSVTQTSYKRNAGGYLKKSQPPVEFEYSQPEIQARVHTVDPRSLENLPYGLDQSQYRWVDLDGEGLSGILTEQGQGWFYKRNLSPITTREEDGRQIVVASFGPMEQVASKPSLANITSGGQQLIDLAGDGQLDLVELQRPAPGFFERRPDEQWETFTTFKALPNLDWSDPNLKFIDLTGDGHADILIAEHQAFVWYPSLAESGFGPSEKVRQAFDEEKGPRLIFADGAQAVYLSDMSGDGLNDLVRIRNREVCYWPNLGYGRFGTKVTMDNAALFDAPDQFDLKRIRLADIDGSGVADIIYLKHDGVHVYFNQSGNSWSLGQKLTAFPEVDDLSEVQTLDLLGNGTACLVWSSALPEAAGRAMRYIDLMGGQKPHLLTRMINNLGAETVVHYAPSTKFYLADKLSGKPWLTKLPFPVHVVESVETYDRISRARFVAKYAYHHGYFDGFEREFRGFGMVEQWDTEELAVLTTSGELPVGGNIDVTSHVPPVHTKTWSHTGAYIGRDHVSNFFAGMIDKQDRGDYYREPAWSDDDDEARKHLLADAILPADLSANEDREACRALKGSMLRQEVYADDGTDKASHPYTVTEQNFSIKLLQATGGNRHAVFFTHGHEAITYHYERNPTDPRTTHNMTLEVDEFGNTLRSLAIGYPRANVPEREPEQSVEHLTLTLSRFTNRDNQPDWRHIGLPVETRSYEVVKPPTTGIRLVWEELSTLIEVLMPLNQTEPGAAKTIPYEQWDWRKLWNPITEPGGVSNTRLRLTEHVRTLYRPDDLGAAQNDPLVLLPLGAVESLALPGESYKLAYTSGLLSLIYKRPLDVLQPPGSPPPEDLLPNAANVLSGQGANRGGYVDLDNNGAWWIPAGRVFFSPGAADTAAQELAHAGAHFFRLHRYRDPFHTNAVSTESVITYDKYDLLLVETRDALGNRVTIGERDVAGSLAKAGNDYRVLQPRIVMDANRNRRLVAFDVAGMVVGTAVTGKPLPAQVEGDTLDGFNADLTDAVILDHLDHPLINPLVILGRATTRLVYDLFAYHRTKDQANPQPPVVYTLMRETHDSDPVPDGGLKIQHNFSYSDGFGREIQKKLQAEPGPVPKRLLGTGKIIVGSDGLPEMTPNDITPRWVGTGWTVLNNKGKPVRQYEPFFTDTHRFEFDVRIGVSPVLFYDPVERVVATLHPDHSWEKAVFDPWKHETWDVSDTVLVLDPQNDPDVGGFFNRLPDEDYLPTWFSKRVGGSLGPEEEAAAHKTVIHAATPTVVQADSLGRDFVTVAHNRFKYSDTAPGNPPVDQFHTTRFILDSEGNHREVVDALGRIVMRYNYDILGTRVHQASMEGGERWSINDVKGKTLRVWDSRNHQLRTTYDPLRRPMDALLRVGNGTELVVGRTVYGETMPNAELNNLRDAVVQSFDQAGVVSSDLYDYKHNLLRSQRKLAQEYKTILDWSAAVPLEVDTYTNRTAFDALNRPTALTAPDNSVIRPAYNEANLLQRVDTNLRGEQQNDQPVWTPFVTDIDYDAKGQRSLIDYGNNVRTTYEYDRLTFRLKRMVTSRDANAFSNDCRQPPPDGWPGCQAQNLSYVYDPAGNVTHIRDEAQQTIYFNNKRVDPGAEYTYDAVYRLIEATGREHLGQVGGTPIPHSYNDVPRTRLPHPNDGNAMGTYLERYVYDAVGSFQQVIHRGSNPANFGWTRAHAYNEPSQLEPGKQSNRLTSTTIGTTTEIYSTGGDGYEVHGNMLRLPQLQILQWDFKDQLQMTQRQAVNPNDNEGLQLHGERTWYVYDSTGQRIRKITELASGQVKDHHIYLGGFEIYNRQGVNPLKRETLRIMDDKHRIALVETRTEGDEPGVPVQFIRYQFSNQLGSVLMELNDQAQIISYEEYYPYGSTSYQAVRSQTVTAKRYRYTGKERDEESGLYYHGARYYAPWLARWIICDPEGIRDGTNPYCYVRCNPIRLNDPTGKQTDPPQFPSITIDLSSGRVLGLGRGTIDVPGFGTLPHVETFLTNATRNTGLPVVQIGNLPGFAQTWGQVQGSGLPPGFRGLPSGVLVQQALEGAHGITDIHITTTGVDIRGDYHTSAELRSIVGSLGSGSNTEVNIHIQEGANVSTIPRGGSQVQGDPLPDRISQHLPPSFRGSGQEGGSAPGSAGSSTPAAPSAAAAPAAAPGSARGGGAARPGAGGGSGTARPSSGGGSGAARPTGNLVNFAGNAAGNVVRATVPGVVEAEIALGGGAIYAHAAGYTAVGTALETGAAAVPVIGGSLIAGAVVGNLAEAGARQLGASDAVAEGTGAGAAMLAGAGVGALIGAPAGGIGALPGAILGGAVGLGGYYLSKMF